MSSSENPRQNGPEFEPNQELEFIPVGSVLKGITFSEETASGNPVFRSDSPDRKILFLDNASPRPEPGSVYKVKIVKDTDPEDPTKGKLFGIIIKERADLSEDDWKKIDESVNDIEVVDRKSKRASAQVYSETRIPKTEREGMTAEELAQRSENPGIRPRVLQKALNRDESRKVEESLGRKGSWERILANLRSANLRKALREDAALEDTIEALRDEQVSILRTQSGEPSGAELDALDEINEQLKEEFSRKKALYEESPEAFVGLHLAELKEYKEQLTNGKIVETPYVKRQVEDVLTHFRANKPILIYGHLGSGKTELAMHIARNYVGKEALVISGSKHTSLAELYGHQILTLDKFDPAELSSFAKMVETQYENWVEENKGKLATLTPDQQEQEKNRAHDRFLQTYLSQLKSGTISDFFLGPIYRAMEEGRPIIIDEVNAIPHEILISLNHVLTRKIGDKMSVQQDSGREVTVQEGYGVIMTGNLNQGQNKYVDRQDLDPAFLSRLYKLEYDYLPQKTEGELKDEAGSENELFQLFLTRIMDDNGNIEAPADAIKKLWNLAKAARVTQNVFAGKEVNQSFYFKEAGGRATKYLLKESVMSLRAIDNVLTQWQKEGYKKELDFYLWKEFVSQSTQTSDRAYLYQILKDRFGFFTSGGWEQAPNYGSGGVVNTFDVAAPSSPALEKEFRGPRETVTYAFGEIPERKEWPKVNKEALVREARELLGNDFFGPEALKTAFGIDIAEEDLPEMTYNLADLGAAKELGEMLVLRVPQMPDGKPMNIATMMQLLKEEPHGPEVQMRHYSQSFEDYPVSQIPAFEWKLVKKEFLEPDPEVQSWDYLKQTVQIRDYLRKNHLGEDYEYDDLNEAKIGYIEKALDGGTDTARVRASRALSDVLININHRRNAAEAFYDLVLAFKNRPQEKLEEGFDWTTTKIANGGFVYVGYVDGKIIVNSADPADASYLSKVKVVR